MVDIKTLLPELRKLVGELTEDLIARCTSDSTINAGLKEAFEQIEKGGRTAQAYEVWREDYLDQVAVAWVLACVFVRFMEDNHLIDECWLAGEGSRRKLAEDTHELFFREHPHDTDREYFQHVFKEVGKIPAAKDLFAEGKTPLWAVAPSGDAAMKLLKFWREMNPAAGTLKRTFQVESGDTRFLGDLYQELSERAKKKFALLQTPVFVEEFILDRTLTPALAEFGLEKVRMIDPTCGSGHFLLGGFARLFDLWSKPDHTTGNAEKDAQKALDGVWGVDINPFAVAIARFRLIVAAVQACEIKRLKKAPGWNIHLASGDSLLFGSKPSFGGERVAIAQQMSLFEVPAIYAVEDRKTLQQILGQGYHVVVGNPPYIIVRDRVQNAAIRELYSACSGKYSLGVPFTQRFWELSIQSGESKSGSGYVGLITTNSFMKREFGKKLIEEFFPKTDLTHVIDTSGAYIPGHSTPTAILFGRSRRPIDDNVRAVLGIKGEPTTPDDASEGVVWQSIVRYTDTVGAQNDYISTTDISRTTFNRHPWSIGGGGSSDLMELLSDQADQLLGQVTDAIGPMAMTMLDDAFLGPAYYWNRSGIPYRPFVTGESVRDWHFAGSEEIAYPYDSNIAPQDIKQLPGMFVHLWPFKQLLESRLMFGKTQTEAGLGWHEYRYVEKARARTTRLILFPCVATHNHFALSRGTIVANRHAPVIKLPATASESDHFVLLGLLNSSLGCFWMKQVFYPKATAVGDISTDKGRPEANRFEFAGTGLLSFPLPSQDLLNCSSIAAIAGAIDDLAWRSAAIQPAKLLTQWSFGSGKQSLSDAFAAAAASHETMKKRMIALQEELDWEAYKVYGLADEGAFHSVVSDQNCGIVCEHRPFMWASDAAPDGLPTPCIDSYQRRHLAVAQSHNLRLVETLVYKRPWWGRQGVYGQASRTYKEWIADACHDWLLDRLEIPKYRKGTKDRPELITTAQMADVASADAEFLEIAALFRGRPDFDVAALVSELVERESVPLLAILRYKPAGLRKREVWERMWGLQRQQDAGQDVGEILLPPKYVSADFPNADYWRLRGKLDVPKERWVSYPHCATDSDPTLVVGWAGWNHLEQATALIAYYDARKREGWDAKRLTPLLAGLDQLLPWIHQWHPEIDAEFGETAGQSFQTMLEHDAHELGLTLDDVRNWTPPEKVKKTRTSSKKKTTVGDGDDA